MMKTITVHDGRVVKVHVPTAHAKRAGCVKITVGPEHRVITEVMSPVAAVELAHAILEAASKARQIDDIASKATMVVFRPDDGFPLCEGWMIGPDDGKSTLYPTKEDAIDADWEHIRERVRHAVKNGDFTDTEEGIHHCPTSPTFRCVYHPATDGGRGDDECLFCGDPYERK